MKTQKQAARYRSLLLKKRAELLSDLGDARFNTIAEIGRVAEDDQAQITHEEFIALHLNRLDYTQLRLVDEALARLDRGGYGVCTGCEEPIPPNRLQAIPWAEYCVFCQERSVMQSVSGIEDEEEEELHPA